MSRPNEYRSGMPDGIVDGCFNPLGGTRELAVRVDGAKLDFFRRFGLPGFRDAVKIPIALREPCSVFETVEGDFLFYRQFEDGRRMPAKIFYVRVRPTGWRAFVWDHEPADPEDAELPADRRDERIRRRVR